MAGYVWRSTCIVGLSRALYLPVVIGATSANSWVSSLYESEGCVQMGGFLCYTQHRKLFPLLRLAQQGNGAVQKSEERTAANVKPCSVVGFIVRSSSLPVGKQAKNTPHTVPPCHIHCCSEPVISFINQVFLGVDTLQSKEGEAHRFGELIEKHGRYHLIEPLLDNLGPSIELQLNDLADMLEVCAKVSECSICHEY